MLSNFDAQQFAAAVKQLAYDALSQPHHDAGLAAVRQIQQFSEETSPHLIGEDHFIDCRAGCAHCCIVNVAVLQPEADSIAGYLLENKTAEELLDLYQYICNLEKETSCLDDEERIMARKKCAFLDSEENCGIYPVRPLLCRAVTSTDVNACIEALAMIAFGENRPIVSNLLQREIFETAFSSFGQALEKYGRDKRSNRLTASVRIILDKKLNSGIHHENPRGTNVN